MRAFDRHLVVFVKAPRMSQVKSRLAAGIGALAAQHFYRLATERLLRRLHADKRWRVTLAVTPSRDRAARFWPAALPRIAQQRGDLGRRMARAFAALSPGPVVIVGSDIPDLDARHVAAAFRALGSHDAVLGPASDGGYWLIGLQHTRLLPRGLFASVRWSTPHARSDTRASLPRRWRVALLEELHDIDTAEDYRRWRERAIE